MHLDLSELSQQADLVLVSVVIPSFQTFALEAFLPREA